MAYLYDYESPHKERHRSHRSNWLRAGVLGANDGIVSTSSLMLGVLAASQDSRAILVAGIAGLIAGALSMAAGEFVAVSSQRDSERADIDIERRSIEDNPEEELEELVWIYKQRGLDDKLARQVARKLHDHDALSAHARDELGIDQDDYASPLQAAVASAIAFSFGAMVPILASLFDNNGGWLITFCSLLALGISGAVGAVIGGGRIIIAALRVLIGGSSAMTITYIIGHIVGLNI